MGASKKQKKSKSLTLSENIQQKEFTLRNSSFSNVAGKYYDSTFVKNGASAYAFAALAYICIKYKVSKFVEAALMAVQENDDGEVYIKNHRLRSLFVRANSDYRMREFLEECYITLQVEGAVAIIMTRAQNGNVADLRAFAQHEFEIRRKNNKIIGEFVVRTSQGAVSVDASDVIYLRYYNPTDRVRGLAPLDVALSHIEISETLKDTVRNALKNRTMPGGVISFPDKMDDDNFERTTQAIRQKFSGSENAGVPMLLEDGATYTATAMSLKDMQLGELWKDTEAVVSGCFQIPPVLVGMRVGLEQSSYNNVKEAKRSFYDETIVPDWTMFEDSFSDALLTPQEKTQGIYIRFDKSKISILQDDLEQLSRISELNKEVLTINERRQLLGKSALTGYDVIFSQLAVSSVELEATAQKNKEEVIETKKENKDTEKLGKYEVKKLKSTEEAIWKKWDENVTIAVNQWKAVTNSQFAKDRKAIIEIIEEAANKKSLDDALTEEQAGKIIKSYARHLSTSMSDYEVNARKVISKQAKKALVMYATSLDIEIEAVAEGIEEYVDARVALLIDSMSKTTALAVTTAVKESVSEGVLLRDLINTLKELPDFDEKRAELVARTETVSAYNGAPYEVLLKSDLELVKVWVTASDPRVRDSHANLNGKIKKMDEAFDVNGTKMMYPQDFNERCTLVYREIANDNSLIDA